MPPRKFVLPRSNNGDALPPTTKKSRRAAKQRPEGMSNTDWAADVQRRVVVNQDRYKREAAVRMKKAAAARLQLMVRLTASASSGPKVASLLR
jgi:hypothetical protein